MSNEAAALGESDANPDDMARTRRVSPDITEVLHLIGAMERLVDDVEERHRAIEAPGSD
jgi:hypothetical protein